MTLDAPLARPWLVLFTLAMGGFAIGTAEFSAMAMVPYIARAFAVSEAAISSMVSAYALGVVVGAPLIAVLFAKMERKVLLIGLMVAFAVFNTASAIAPTYPVLLVTRFLSGLPHGAYFGAGALLAASVVGPNQRGKAVSRMFLGITTATIIGVPFSNVLGQTLGWRWGFALVGVIALVTAVTLAVAAPRAEPGTASNPLRELSALKNRQVLLTLATAMICFGGFFAFYTYLASTLIEVTQVSEATVPMYLMLIGVAMTIGTLIAGWAADKSLTLSTFVMMSVSGLVLLIYPSVATSPTLIAMIVVVVGVSNGLPILLQTRLMDVAHEAQSLAAALNHSAFNAANAIGPIVAAFFIARGYGFESSGYVGAGLSLAGILMFALTIWDAKRRPN